MAKRKNITDNGMVLVQTQVCLSSLAAKGLMFILLDIAEHLQPVARLETAGEKLTVDEIFSLCRCARADFDTAFAELVERDLIETAKDGCLYIETANFLRRR